MDISIFIVKALFMKDNSEFQNKLKVRVRGTIANVSISFIVFLVFIGILEIVLRTTHLFMAKTPWIKSDPLIGYRYIPGSKYWRYGENDHPITGRINSHGWRDKEWSLKKPQNTYRIAVLGDSMVASLDVETERTFLALTENQLNPVGNCNVELMNFGFSNISQAEELLILKNDIGKFSPDMVLLFFFPGNDINDMDRVTASHIKRPFYDISTNGELLLDTSFSKTSHYKTKYLIELFKQHSALVNLIGERYYGYKEQRQNKIINMNGKREKEPLSKYLSLCTANPDATFIKNYQLNKLLIKAMSEYCKEKGVRFMLVTVDLSDSYTPELEKKYKAIDPTFDANFFEDDLRNYAASLRIDYFGLQRIFRQAYENTGVPLRWAHWNYEGHKVVAEALSGKLRNILGTK